MRRAPPGFAAVRGRPLRKAWAWRPAAWTVLIVAFSLALDAPRLGPEGERSSIATEPAGAPPGPGQPYGSPAFAPLALEQDDPISTDLPDAFRCPRALEIDSSPLPGYPSRVERPPRALSA